MHLPLEKMVVGAYLHGKTPWKLELRNYPVPEPPTLDKVFLLPEKVPGVLSLPVGLLWYSF